MDAKELSQLKELHARFVAGSFDEHDAKSLMLMLRNENVVLREFGDFVAHRERDQGRFHALILKIRSLLEGTMAGGADCTEEVLTLSDKGVFSADEIADAVNAAFQARNLAHLDPTRLQGFLLVVMSTLNAAELVADRKAKKKIGTLHMGLDRNCAKLTAAAPFPAPDGKSLFHVTFTVLSIRNTFYPVPRSEGTWYWPADAWIKMVGGALESNVEARMKIRRDAGANAITWSELRSATKGLPIVKYDDAARAIGVLATNDTGTMFTLEQDGAIDFAAMPEYLHPASPVWKTAVELANRLNARIYDQTGWRATL
jgi:hypothetical protein